MNAHTNAIVHNITALATTSHVAISTPRIYDDITQIIGNTPLVRLSRLAKKYSLET